MGTLSTAERQALWDHTDDVLEAHTGRSLGVLVDAYGTGNFLPEAFARHGIEVVHLQSAPEPISRMQPWNEERYLDWIVYNPDGSTEAALKQLQPKFVIPGQEPGVRLADQLSEALGLRTNGTERSAARRDKRDMVEAVAAAGLRTADQTVTDSADEAIAWAEDRGHWPCVAKPLASASTDGVSVCRDAAALRSAFADILGSDTVFNQENTEVLVQSYLEGTEYIVDTVGVDGTAYVCGVWRYEKNLLPNGKPIYDRDILVDPAEPVASRLIEFTREVLDALGVRNGPAHSEIMMTPDGPALIEVGARLNGHLHPEFHNRCMGENGADLTATAYMEPDRFLEQYGGGVYSRLRAACVYNAPTVQSGVVTSTDEELVECIRNRPSVVDLSLKRKAGDTIVPTHDLLTSPLRVFLTNTDEDALEADYTCIASVRESVYRVRSRTNPALCGVV
ncbi:ATP-grasp domain-containing protein [Glycomyces xiaoerkulensis]|uniref:ATP-grasp domain-containing protein n=1 Tax=Glycomyces xiaoerkulensis TaxID=2038139 RepID=UPI0018E3FC12|nr:ATP-grasp domain-containing protein [Glycomyces xiaoerkulensis]